MVALSILFGAVIAYRLLYIQHAEGDKWRARSVRLHEKFQDLPPKRGNIWTADGDVLATSLIFYRLAMDPSLSSEEVLDAYLDDFSHRLSAYFGGSAADYKRRVLAAKATGKRYVLLSRKLLSYTDKQHLLSWPYFSLGASVSGVIFESVNRRFFPFSPLADRTIGNTNWAGKGVVGLEYSFNDILAGKGGKVLVRRVAGGWTPIYDGSEIFPEDGEDLVVTLNMEMQDIVQSSLLRGVLRSRARHASVILMEVATGAIKAIANLSHNEVEDKYYETYNYAVGMAGCVEPGSTFKLVTMLSLLEKSNVLLSDVVDTGDGRYEVLSEVMRDHRRGGFGLLTVQDVFEQSSNIGMAKLAMQYFRGRPHDFINYLRMLQLHRPLNFGIKGVGVPYVKFQDDPSWSGTSLAWMAHGYELTLTPLHLLIVYNAVANGGRMMAPYLVCGKRVNDEVAERYAPQVLVEAIASKANVQRVRTLLEGVVERGTAQRIAGSTYGIAGKTGTAKKLKKGRYVNEYYASFVGYFPKDNPKYSCIVVIDEPRMESVYGGDVAAPIFRDIADRLCVLDTSINPNFTLASPVGTQTFPLPLVSYVPAVGLLFEQMGIPHEPTSAYAWGMAYVDEAVIRWKPRVFEDKKVPNVAGMSLRDALFILENAHLRVERRGSGRVITQRPRAGTHYQRGQRILLTLSLPSS